MFDIVSLFVRNIKKTDTALKIAAVSLVKSRALLRMRFPYNRQRGRPNVRKRKKKIDLRKIQVLKIIVEEYLKTGEITGSKSLLKKHDMGVSSATVRNDMAALEKMGLIFQPYNSA
jgi:hypothetical protein